MPVKVTPAKVATPDTADWLRHVVPPPVQPRVPPDDVTVTAFVAVATVVLVTSAMRMTGCVVSADPETPAAGAVATSSWLAVPGRDTEMVVVCVVTPSGAVTTIEMALVWPAAMLIGGDGDPEATATPLIVMVEPADADGVKIRVSSAAVTWAMYAFADVGVRVTGPLVPAAAVEVRVATLLGTE